MIMITDFTQFHTHKHHKRTQHCAFRWNIARKSRFPLFIFSLSFLWTNFGECACVVVCWTCARSPQKGKTIIRAEQRASSNGGNSFQLHTYMYEYVYHVPAIFFIRILNLKRQSNSNHRTHAQTNRFWSSNESFDEKMGSIRNKSICWLITFNWCVFGLNVFVWGFCFNFYGISQISINFAQLTMEKNSNSNNYLYERNTQKNTHNTNLLSLFIEREQKNIARNWKSLNWNWNWVYISNLKLIFFIDF